MSDTGNLTLALGLTLFTFLITSLLLVPFIDLLYKFKLLRRKEAPTKGKIPLFDKLHDKKAGTPVGGGILMVCVITITYLAMFPFARHMGIFIDSFFDLQTELFIIIFTFVSFGLLGFLDDYIKVFGKTTKGTLGLWVGLKRKHKFALQVVLATITSLFLYKFLGIHIIHIPLVDYVVDLKLLFVPFAALVIIFFTNAFNITDGLDGLSSGLLIIFLVAFGAISAGNLDTPLSLFIALSVGSLLAFTYFNIFPARLHLGDVGALAFGAVIALIGLLNGSIVSLFVIGGIFVVELLSSAIQILGWKYLKRPIFPLAPLHHAFLARGWEEPKIVMRAWLAGIVLAIFGLWLATI
ncbi:phospho-N-acetylmuramoyl-pentapeptide-transferase [Patescibacteria group bacterium]